MNKLNISLSIFIKCKSLKFKIRIKIYNCKIFLSENFNSIYFIIRKSHNKMSVRECL